MALSCSSLRLASFLGLSLVLTSCSGPQAEQEEQSSEGQASPDDEDSPSPQDPSQSPEPEDSQSDKPDPSEQDPDQDSPAPDDEDQSEDSKPDDEPDPENPEPEDSPKGTCGDIPFDAQWLKQRVSELSGAIEAKVNGKSMTLGERFTKEGREKGRAWIRAQYEALGYEVSEHSFSSGVNVVATKAGNSDEFFVFSAHHDTVRNCPGADDDAAGITSVLAMAAALAPCDLEFSVRFVSFDQEENGLVGSKAYAKDLKASGESKKMKGNIQIEMSAYDSDNDGSFNVIDCDDPQNTFLVDALKESISDESLALLPVHDCVTASDHSSFWNIDVPAIAVSQLFFGKNKDRTPCYHQSCDKVDILNFQYMNELTVGLAHAGLKLLQAH